MNNMGSRKRSVSLSFAVLLALASHARAESINVDVLVYSANPAGIAAAMAVVMTPANLSSSQRSSSRTPSVLLLEPLTMIGGMGAAGGVGLMNQGAGEAGATGLAREWGLLNGKAYGQPAGTINLFPAPSVMAASFLHMLNGTAVATRLGCRLTNVARLSSLCLASADFLCDNDTASLHVTAKYFIDASYDGDVMVQAGGITYASGREPRSAFNESLAGVSLLDEPNESFDRQNLTVDAVRSDGKGLLPGISPEPLLPAGTGDDRLMAFSYFACVTNSSDAVPYPEPPGYDPEDFALLQRTIDAAVASGKYPNGPDLAFFSEYATYSIPHTVSRDPKLLLCCGVSPVNCDQPDLNRGYANASHEQRVAMQQAHRYYLQGSLYYMANDPRVPSYTRYAVGRWGLCPDEYADHGHWPPQIYVRISNRLQGEVLLTQNNLANPRSKPDGVAVGCWEFDQHTMSRHAVRDPHNASRMLALNEGYMRHDIEEPFLPCTHPNATCNDRVQGGNWYDVPFGVMLPRRGQATNLLVSVAISTTSIAYSSTRIENMYMDLGTAAGVAVALALQRSSESSSKSTTVTGHAADACPLAVQDTDVAAVQEILTTVFKQRIHGPIL